MDFALDPDVKFDLAFAIISLVCLDVDIPYFNSLILLYVIKLSVTLQVAFFPFVSSHSHLIFCHLECGQRCCHPSPLSIHECSVGIHCHSYLHRIWVLFLHGGVLQHRSERWRMLKYDSLLINLSPWRLSFWRRHSWSYQQPGTWTCVFWLQVSSSFPLLFHHLFSKLTARIAYDVCFFVVIIVLLLNIIFGIIIDTFGQLREESSEKKELMASFCFICGISKDVFDSRASNGALGGVGGLNFTGHIENEHNMWDYMLFLLYLQEKNPNDYNGIERWGPSLPSPYLMLHPVVTLLNCTKKVT